MRNTASNSFVGYAVRGSIQTDRRRSQTLRLPAKQEGRGSCESIAGSNSSPTFARVAVIPTIGANGAGYVKAAGENNGNINHSPEREEGYP